ncbi:Phospholipid/glycerol acyltransferase domain-containing protein [Pleurotus pulmonarius]
MELKVVYRILRKISDWTLEGYYSEVHIAGSEHVPKNGPLIITPTHHNELIDIATVAATIPYRRHVSFWAKSTMFVNPVTRAILVSAGSIPVKRNPNRTPDVDASLAPTSQADLFHDSFLALSQGQVLGVFPEGTSYTEPCIAQIMSGAAWAAVEYAKWQRGGGATSKVRGLVIVPVGIVYTDKARYRSRLVVRYGRPIDVTLHCEEVFASTPKDIHENTRKVVKTIMAEVESQLTAMTINAPDWDTVYASRIAKDMLWVDTPVPLQVYVEVSQLFVDIFSKPDFLHARNTLVEYYSLLHYTRLSHASLDHLYPLSDTNTDTHSSFLPSLASSASVFLKQLLNTLLHPRALCFLPPFLVHRPAYILGTLAARFLANPEEEEGQAQFKAIFGGFGAGLSYGLVTWRLSKWLQGIATGTQGSFVSTRPGIFSTLRYIGLVLAGQEGNPLQRVLTLGGLFYGVSWILVRWHNSLIDSNYRQFKRLVGSFRIFRGLLSQPCEVTASQLDHYARPPPPPVNPFIKRRIAINNGNDTEHEDRPSTRSRNPGIRVPTGMLIRHLFDTRVKALRALNYVCMSMDDQQSDFLRNNGCSAL